MDARGVDRVEEFGPDARRVVLSGHLPFPVEIRESWMTTLSAEPICSRIALDGRSNPAMRTIVSMRERASLQEFAWMVEMEPSWPVFIACSMSSASPPRTSPTMIRSGRIRRALRTRSRCVTVPFPSMLEGRVSSRTVCSCCRISSAASSTVMIRSSSGIEADRMFRKVVFPAPVPPDTRMFILAFTMASKTAAISALREPLERRFSIRSGFTPNRRIDMAGPSMDRGGMMTLTRDPSASRASTSGDDSSTRRPTFET
ncbi:MAG: hypothetical protein HW408_1688, partial [Actinobacteria bacterium]|nr:hypothetical protein [Actinomycetota bacterium]